MPSKRWKLDDGRPVVLYGIDLQLSEAALAALHAAGVEPAVCADGRTALAGSVWHGLPVVMPEDIPTRFNQPYVVICPSLEFWTVHDRLWNLGLENLIPAADILAATDIDRLDLKKSAATVANAMRVQEGLLASRRGGVFLPMATLVLTERCTLNCRHCSNLMPYIAEKRDYSLKDMLTWLERLSASVDEVISLYIVGGESFLHPDAAAIIAAAAATPNFRWISIVTNATLLPPPMVLNALRAAPKAHVFISNYGPLSRKLDALKTMLTENRIPVDEQPQGVWRDMGRVERRGRSREANRIVFRNCFGKTCGMLLDGKLHRCSRSAFGPRTGHMPDFPDDYVDLTAPAQSNTETREKIRKLFFHSDSLEACDYCDGVRVDTPCIPAAEQTARMEEDKEAT